MTRSQTMVAAGATLNFLKACNIPYVQPLIDVSLHIYNTVDELKANKKDAAELAECIGNAVREIAERHSEELCTPMQQDDINKLLTKLRDTDNSLTTISRRIRFQRLIYYKEDQGTLRKLKESINSAKLDYLFSNELSKNAEKQTETYPIYTLKEIEALRVVKLGLVREEVGRIVQSGEVKSVLIRRYNLQSIKNFLSDIAFYSELTHPNFSFIGASSVSSPSPFMIFENGNYQHAPAFLDQIRDHGSVQELFKHTIIMIPDLLVSAHAESVVESSPGLQKAALNYCEHLKFDFYPESIKYNGHKVILDIKLPPSNPALPILSRLKLVMEKTVVDGRAFAREMYDFIPMDILHHDSTSSREGQLRILGVDMLAALMIPPITYVEPFPDTPAIGPLWPLWLYLHASKADRTLFMVTQKIRDVTLHTGSPVTNMTPHIAHSLILDYGNALYVSVPQYGGYTKAELGDVGYFDGFVFIKVTNILEELRAQLIVGSDIILSGSADRHWGCDRLFGGRALHNNSEESWYTLSSRSDYFHSRIKSSIHDTRDKATRRKVQKYFHNRLPGILAQQLDRSGIVNEHFVLVVEIDDGHSIFSDMPNKRRNLRATTSLTNINQSDPPAYERKRNFRNLRAARSTNDLFHMSASQKYWVRCAVSEYVPD